MDRLNRYTGTLKNVVFILGVVATVCGSAAITINKTLDTKLDRYFNDNLVVRFAEIDSRISEVEGRTGDLEMYVTGEIEKLIAKQYDKIKRDPEVLKRQDLEAAIKYYPTLDNPDHVLQEQYRAIVDYYNKHYS